jgi:hypothetical protein
VLVFRGQFCTAQIEHVSFVTNASRVAADPRSIAIETLLNPIIGSCTHAERAESTRHGPSRQQRVAWFDADVSPQQCASLEKCHLAALT